MNLLNLLQRKIIFSAPYLNHFKFHICSLKLTNKQKGKYCSNKNWTPRELRVKFPKALPHHLMGMLPLP